MKFFLQCTVKKTSLSLPAEKLSCFFQFFAYKYAIYKECWRIKSLFAPKFLCNGKNIGFGNRLRVNFFYGQKIDQFPMKTMHQLSINEVKTVARKHKKFAAFF